MKVQTEATSSKIKSIKQHLERQREGFPNLDVAAQKAAILAALSDFSGFAIINKKF